MQAAAAVVEEEEEDEREEEKKEQRKSFEMGIAAERKRESEKDAVQSFLKNLSPFEFENKEDLKLFNLKHVVQ